MQQTFPQPVTVQLAGYRVAYLVSAVHQERNHDTRTLLTVADATYTRLGGPPHRAGDWVTRMRIADLLGANGWHTLPRNPDRAYGVPRWAKTRGDTGIIGETVLATPDSVARSRSERLTTLYM